MTKLSRLFGLPLVLVAMEGESGSLKEELWRLVSWKKAVNDEGWSDIQGHVVWYEQSIKEEGGPKFVKKENES